MKKFIKNSTSIISLLAFIFLLNGCVKDNITRTYTYSYYLPVYKTTSEVRANIKSNPAREIKAPGKIVIIGNYIFLTAKSNY